MEIAPPSASTKRTVCRTYKYRIYPTAKQAQTLEIQLRACCDIYNAALEQRRWAYRKTGRTLRSGDQQAELTAVRAAGIFPKNMNCYAQRLVLRRLDQAFAAFFRRIRNGEKPGYPRFRSYTRYNSIVWGGSCGVSFTGNRVRLQVIGSVRVRYHRDLPESAEIREITVCRKGGHWYCCVCCRIPLEQTVSIGLEIGVDLGVRNFITISTGETISGFSFDRARLRRASRRISRRKRNSNRRRKAAAILARHSQRIVRHRRDYQHKLSRQLVEVCSLIALEDLDISNMRRSTRGTLEKPGKNVRQKAGLNRRMADQSWAQLITFLEYKAEEAGTRIVKVNPRNTSKVCSNCGTKCEPGPVWFLCSECGLRIDRDVNAARNILALGLGRSLQAPTVEAEAHAVA
jgi:putative transposase